MQIPIEVYTSFRTVFDRVKVRLRGEIEIREQLVLQHYRYSSESYILIIVVIGKKVSIFVSVAYLFCYMRLKILTILLAEFSCFSSTYST